MTPTFYLASQNNFGNRGCEALVRSTVTVLQAAFGSVRVLVPSLDAVRDQAQWPESAEHGVEFVNAPAMSYRLSKWGAACARLPWLKALPHPRLPVPTAALSDLCRADVVLSIGGDNYSLDYGLANLYFHAGIAEAAMALGKPTVLWGASIGPFSGEPGVEKRVVAHLRRLALITVRESRSFEYLAGIGVSENVLPVLDSAFAMQPQVVDTRAWWPVQTGEGVLGLNIGSLVDRLRRKSGQTDGVIGELVGFVRSVMARTRYAVLLVPHVAPLNGEASNNDELFNRQLLQALGGPTKRLDQVPGGLNAAQLKHVISNCRFFIGARTHATIAAFSTAVPTLSVAYSVKAKGINRDLFGDERYVLETSKLGSDGLWAGLELLQRDEAAIRGQYSGILPRWQDRAHSGGYKLAKMMQART
jgi:polysaccharide pyruvyl transferase WcaK-like protein